MAFSELRAPDAVRDHPAHVSLTTEFRGHLRCLHCMIEGTMDRLAPQSDATFDEMLAEQRQSGRWRGIILTGSETTLRCDLPELALRAREAGFAHVAIQTLGARLGDPAYAERLVAARVDEFFVSVAGCDRERHDRITDVAGAWDRMMRGLAHIEAHPHVRVITDTVVTTPGYPLPERIVAALEPFRTVAQLEFWVCWPMAEEDARGLCAPHGAVLPHLAAAIRRARAIGRTVEVRNFPHRLLAREGPGDALVNDQPLLLIDPDFRREFERDGFRQRLHRDGCATQSCIGLNTAHVRRHGWEAGLPAPMPRADEPRR